MYELCRVTIDVFKPGAKFWNAGSGTLHLIVADENKAMLFQRNQTEEPYIITKDYAIIFKEESTFIRVDAIGLGDHSSAPGRMERLLRDTRLIEVWGENTLEDVMAFANTITEEWYFPKTTHVTFIGLFEENEQDHTWKFIGEVPMDERLRNIVVSGVGK